MSEKKIVSSMLWSLFLTNIGWLLIVGSLIGITNPTWTQHPKNDYSTCSSTKCLECVEKKEQSNMMTDWMHWHKVSNITQTP